MSNRSDRLVAARVVAASGQAAQIVFWREADSVAVQFRPQPDASSPGARWKKRVTLPSHWWPGKRTDAAKGASVGTFQGWLSNVLPDHEDLTVEGLWTVEFSEEDHTALDGGAAQPNNLFTKIGKRFGSTPPRSRSFPAEGHSPLRDVAMWLLEGPVVKIEDDLSEYTESALGAAPTVSASSDDLDPITLADGTQFYPVLMPGGMTNVQFLTTAREAGLFVLMHGEPGTGKSRSVEAAFPGHVRLECSESTIRQDIIGGYLEDEDGSMVWYDGPLLEAMQANDGQGCVLFVDEAPLADPRVLASIYAAIDGRDEVTVPENRKKYPKPVKAGPDFYVIFAGNLNVPGAVLSEALRSRTTLRPEYVTDYDTAARILGADHEEIVRVARNMETRRQSDEVDWAPQMRDLIAYRDAAQAFGVQVALSNLVSTPESEADRDVLLETIATTMGVSNIPALRM